MASVEHHNMELGSIILLGTLSPHFLPLAGAAGFLSPAPSGLRCGTIMPPALVQRCGGQTGVGEETSPPPTRPSWCEQTPRSWGCSNNRTYIFFLFILFLIISWTLFRANSTAEWMPWAAGAVLAAGSSRKT